MESKSQLEKGFEALTSTLMSALNPPLADLSQKTLKDSLDKAFESLQTTFNGEFGKAVAFPDEEMINVIQMALAWYQKISSFDEAISYIQSDLNGIRNGVRRVAKDRWVIENVDVLRNVSNMLTERHRTLHFKR